MSEALGIAEEAEEELEIPVAAEAQEFEVAEDTTEEHAEVPHFTQSENHFQGQVQVNEFGRVVDYRYAGGLMSEVAEGAALDKILSLYQNVLETGSVVKKMPDPENSSVTIVHTLTRSENGIIDIWITKEVAVKEKFPERKSDVLSPAEQAAAAAEKLFLLTVTAAETFPIEAEAARPIASAEQERVVFNARSVGITLEGFEGRHDTALEQFPLREAQNRTSAHAAPPQESVELNEEPPTKATSTASAQALDALHSLLRAA